MKTCNIDGCEKPRKARGWCNTHWARWRRHGNPLQGGPIGLRASSPADAFAARTERQGDCLIWTGAVIANGYGRLSANGRMVLAHRFAWECEHGPIPDGLVIDHTCWNRQCVEVSHLRTASHQQNAQNRSGADGGRDLPRGVYRRESGRYAAGLQFEGRRINLGMFDTPEEASAAAETKRRVLFGEFAGRA